MKNKNEILLKLASILLDDNSFEEKSNNHCSNPNGEIRIVILQRGWIVVGNVFQSGPEVRIENGYVIRSWGTTKGIGELEDGPLENTKLDKIPELITHELEIIAQLIVNQNKWKSLCK